jgi:hypothetical protein
MFDEQETKSGWARSVGGYKYMKKESAVVVAAAVGTSERSQSDRRESVGDPACNSLRTNAGISAESTSRTN